MVTDTVSNEKKTEAEELRINNNQRFNEIYRLLSPRDKSDIYTSACKKFNIAASTFFRKKNKLQFDELYIKFFSDELRRKGYDL